MKEDHQHAIDEKDAIIALMNENLQDRDNQKQVAKYENVALQAQRDVYQFQLQKCQDTIIHLRTRYQDHTRDLSKDNIIIIVQKHTATVNDRYHDLPYVAKIQRRKRYVKLGWLDQQFPDHEVIVEIENPNIIHEFNRFEEEGHAERKCYHFRLIDLTQEELYATRVSATLMMGKNKIFHDLNEIMKKLMSTSLMLLKRFLLIKYIRDKHAKIS